MANTAQDTKPLICDSKGELMRARTWSATSIHTPKPEDPARTLCGHWVSLTSEWECKGADQSYRDWDNDPARGRSVQGCQEHGMEHGLHQSDLTICAGNDPQLCKRCEISVAKRLREAASHPSAEAEIPAEEEQSWPAGKTFGDLTPAQRTAAVKRAAGQLQAELAVNADAIGKVMDEAEIPAKAEQSWMRTRGDGVTHHRTDNGQNARCRRELVAYGAVLTNAEMDEMVATVAHTHRCANCQADQAIELAAEGGSGFAPGQPYYEIYPASGPAAFSTKRNPTCVNQGTAEHNAREYSRDGRAYVVELVAADGSRSKVSEFRNGRKVRQ